MLKLVLHPAFILHRRAYMNSSLILILLTKQHGIIHVIAKGARRNSYKMKGLLQPFIALNVSCYGKTNLLQLTHFDVTEEYIVLPKEKLVFGFYLNELIVKLVGDGECCENIYDSYCDVLQSLINSIQVEIALRIFERRLLKEIGFGIDFGKDALSGQLIEEGKVYYFEPMHGFITVEAGCDNQTSKKIFAGTNIMAIARDDYSDSKVLNDAKYILRLSIAQKLEQKEIHSRKMLV